MWDHLCFSFAVKSCFIYLCDLRPHDWLIFCLKVHFVEISDFFEFKLSLSIYSRQIHLQDKYKVKSYKLKLDLISLTLLP